jgi:hypothetical protein
MPIRRTLGRDGRAYYFNERGRRIPDSRGASRYVRENFPSIDRNQLTPREQRSYNASQRSREQFRFEGRFVPNPFGILNRFLVLNNLPPDTRNLSNLFNAEQLNRILDNQYTSDITTFRENVNSIFERYTTQGGDLLDSYSDISDYMRRGYEFVLMTENEVYRNREGLEALRDFEQMWQQYYLDERGSLLDNVEFTHRIRVNPANRTIEIDTDETEIEPRGGTP